MHFVNDDTYDENQRICNNDQMQILKFIYSPTLSWALEWELDVMDQN